MKMVPDGSASLTNDIGQAFLGWIRNRPILHYRHPTNVYQRPLIQKPVTRLVLQPTLIHYFLFGKSLRVKNHVTMSEALFQER
ncbi:hypothetical protein EV681_0085 [Advenella incenata]|uniref:Uncharacterized protein n=1 Tax=Advenella incenata TaxID=267800 RepID=A0A4Q7VPL1_9BURK|nr:hypothetical protein EV681_0085 [Advenella incenata]